MAKNVEAKGKVLGKISMNETPAEELMSAKGSVNERPQPRKPEPKQTKVLGSQPRGQGG